MRFKRLVIVLTILNILFVSLTTSVRVDAAYSKGVTIAAKKAAKEVAKDAAVEMANQIVAEFLVRELLEGVNTDPGYAPVCMDGPKQKLEDCAPDKRAQVKKLDSADKKVLEKKVETVLEKKTSTSSKWAKFIDWFVPMFLAAGVIEFISSAISDDDILSFFDEVAQEALIEAQFLKPIAVTVKETELLDFSNHVQSYSVSKVYRDSFNVGYKITAVLKPNQTIKYSATSSDGRKNLVATQSLQMEARFQKSFGGVGSYETFRAFAVAKAPNKLFLQGAFIDMSTGYELYRGKDLHCCLSDPSGSNIASNEAESWLDSNILGQIQNKDVNAGINFLVNAINTNPGFNLKFDNLVTIKVPPEIVPVEYGTQTSIDKLKGEDGNYKFKGIDSFDFKDGDRKVYPSKDSSTGWKDRETHEDVTVNEDNITVNDKTETETDKEEDEEQGGKCTRDFKKIRFDKVGTAFTNAFPFSIPWDIKRFFDSTFSGVGNEKPRVDLSFLGPNVTMTVPDLIDTWMPYLRNFLLISFDLAIIYMFYRFLRGGGD